MKGVMPMYSETFRSEALALLKANVGNLRPPLEIEQLMLNCIDTAGAALLDAKISLDENCPDDLHLLAMYAAWLYRNRSSGAGKPEMLRSTMRNRQVSEATGEADI